MYYQCLRGLRSYIGQIKRLISPANILMIGALPVASLGQAQSFKSPIKSFTSPQERYQRVESHAFIHQGFGLQASSPYQKFNKGQSDVLTFVKSFLNERGLHPHISIEAQYRNNGLNLHGGDSQFLQAKIQGVPFCQSEFKLFPRNAQRRFTIFRGNMPDIDGSNIPPSSDWPSVDDVLQLIKDRLTNDSAFVVTDSRHCLVAEERIAKVALQMEGTIDAIPYQVLGTSDVLHRFDPHYFDALGQVRAFDTNSQQGSLVDYTIGQLIGDGTMTSLTFTTTPVGVPRAYSSSHEFVYDPSDSKFAEASVFAHATRTFAWFQSLGFNYTNSQPIDLRVHAVNKNDPNNALYTPSSSSGAPTILVGDGDGIMLANLATDGDVISHEFGHHVIYQSLKETRGQSLVLHEGLADFFTFARTDDPCLGNSICPVNSPISCQIPGQCLRTAENSYRYTDSNLPVQAHFRSQLFSGLLWDLRTGGAIPPETVTKIVYNSLKFYLSDSGYHDFVLALMLADEEISSGQYQCDIYNAALERKLDSFISDFDCQNGLPNLVGDPNGAGGSTLSRDSSTTTVTSKSTKSGCAVLHVSETQEPYSALVGLMLFLLVLGAPLPLKRR
jgi:hypothetical protein